MRIGFAAITSPEQFAKADEWARSTGGQLREGLPTWWIKRENGEVIGVTQRAMVPVLGLVLDPKNGRARETIAVLDALRHAAELEGSDPLICTHEDSAMSDLHDRMLTSAGDKTRIYWFRKTKEG